MPHSTNEVVHRVFALAVPAIVLGGFILWTILKAEEPVRMACKWLLTIPIVAYMILKVGPMMGQGGFNAIFALPLTAACGVALTIIWRRSIAALIAEPFGSLYDGGRIPPEPRPAYSIAQAKQKKGQYLEAIAGIRQQLDRFPTDFEGHMLLAQIQAEDLKDLPAAELTIQHLCAQPGHAPANLTFALYSLADWHLRFGPDREAARCALEEVIALLPDTEFALNAAQRIAHLSTAEGRLAPHEHKTFTLTQGPRNLGLLQHPLFLQPAEKDPGQMALEYVQHLEAHPQDTDARERLAELYVSHYGRLDLAADQLGQMIQQPNQPGRLVVRWLNLLADLQVRGGTDYDTVRQTLQRIINRDPRLAAAEIARKRIELLKLEFKAKEKNQPIKMGVYEQNVGLKRGGKSSVMREKNS